MTELYYPLANAQKQYVIENNKIRWDVILDANCIHIVHNNKAAQIHFSEEEVEFHVFLEAKLYCGYQIKNSSAFLQKTKVQGKFHLMCMKNDLAARSCS